MCKERKFSLIIDFLLVSLLDIQRSLEYCIIFCGDRLMSKDKCV